jgi:hypothetical protein
MGENPIEEEGEMVNKLASHGASELFIEYYEYAPGNASARAEIEVGPFSIEELADNPRLGGHFFEALWEGDRLEASHRADIRNSRLLTSIRKNGELEKF